MSKGKVLIIVGDATETVDTLYPFYRLIEGGFQPNQYFNEANPDSHYHSTGPELWRQTGEAITHLVVAVGTGGTISGVGRYLKERNPEIEVIGRASVAP